jgi:hypothetical protein
VSVFRNDPQKVALEKYLQLCWKRRSEKSGAKGRKPYHHGREGVSTSISASGALGRAAYLSLSLANGFHEKASLVKVNVVTKAPTMQDKTPLPRFHSL